MADSTIKMADTSRLTMDQETELSDPEIMLTKPSRFNMSRLETSYDRISIMSNENLVLPEHELQAMRNNNHNSSCEIQRTKTRKELNVPKLAKKCSSRNSYVGVPCSTQNASKLRISLSNIYN